MLASNLDVIRQIASAAELAQSVCFVRNDYNGCGAAGTTIGGDRNALEVREMPPIIRWFRRPDPTVPIVRTVRIRLGRRPQLTWRQARLRRTGQLRLRSECL